MNSSSWSSLLQMALPCLVWQRFPVCLGALTLMYTDGVDSSLTAWMTSLMSSPILSDRLMGVHAHAHTVAGAPAVHSPSSCSTRGRFYELPWAAIYLCHTLAPLLCSMQHVTNQPADGIVLLDIYCFWLNNDQMLYLCSPCLQILRDFLFYILFILENTIVKVLV